ncbi:hypothetical protein ScPMuIL_012409 [Solemya velum]
MKEIKSRPHWVWISVANTHLSGVIVGNDCKGFTLTSVLSMCEMGLSTVVSLNCMGLELSQVKDMDSCWCYIQPQTDRTVISVTTSKKPGYVGCGTNITITGPSTSNSGDCRGLSFASEFLSPEQTVSMHVNQSTPGQSTGNEYCLNVCPTAGTSFKMTCCPHNVQDCYNSTTETPSSITNMSTTTVKVDQTTTTKSPSDGTIASTVSKIDSTTTKLSSMVTEPNMTPSSTKLMTMSSTEESTPRPSTDPSTPRNMDPSSASPKSTETSDSVKGEIIGPAVGSAVVVCVAVVVTVICIRRRKRRKDMENGNGNLANNSTANYENVGAGNDNHYQNLGAPKPNHFTVEGTEDDYAVVEKKNGNSKFTNSEVMSNEGGQNSHAKNNPTQLHFHTENGDTYAQVQKGNNKKGNAELNQSGVNPTKPPAKKMESALKNEARENSGAQPENIDSKSNDPETSELTTQHPDGLTYADIYFTQRDGEHGAANKKLEIADTENIREECASNTQYPDGLTYADLQFCDRAKTDDTPELGRKVPDTEKTIYSEVHSEV